MRGPADWRKLFNGETPTHNRQFLERQLAYKLQQVEFHKVDPGLLERNKKKIASLIAREIANSRWWGPVDVRNGTLRSPQEPA